MCLPAARAAVCLAACLLACCPSQQHGPACPSPPLSSPPLPCRPGPGGAAWPARRAWRAGRARLVSVSRSRPSSAVSLSRPQLSTPSASSFLAPAPRGVVALVRALGCSARAELLFRWFGWFECDCELCSEPRAHPATPHPARRSGSHALDASTSRCGR